MARKKRRFKSVFFDDKLHVMREQCSTCVFRPGNLMHLREGVLKHLVEESLRKDTGIPCHSTLHTTCPALCRGFYDNYSTVPIRLAQAMGCIEEVDLPEDSVAFKGKRNDDEKVAEEEKDAGGIAVRPAVQGT